MNRRALIRGIGASLLAAPAIVRAASLMAISPLPELDFMLQLKIHIASQDHVLVIPYEGGGWHTLPHGAELLDVTPT